RFTTRMIRMTEVNRVEGVLEVHPRGHGFLRQPERNYTPQSNDPYVPVPLIQRLQLKEGLLVAGTLQNGRPPRGASGPRLERVEEIEGRPAGEYRPRKFDDLTPIDPHERIRLETGS